MNNDATEIPEIDSRDFVGPAALSNTLRAISLPVWVRAGNARHKVTEENRAGFLSALLLASEMAEHAREDER